MWKLFALQLKERKLMSLKFEKKLQKNHELKSAFLSIIDRLSFLTFKILCLELLMYFSKVYKNISFHT